MVRKILFSIFVLSASLSPAYATSYNFFSVSESRGFSVIFPKDNLAINLTSATDIDVRFPQKRHWNVCAQVSLEFSDEYLSYRQFYSPGDMVLLSAKAGIGHKSSGTDLLFLAGPGLLFNDRHLAVASYPLFAELKFEYLLNSRFASGFEINGFYSPGVSALGMAFFVSVYPGGKL